MPEIKQSWNMLPVRQSIISSLSPRQKLWLLLNLKIIRSQELQSVTSYISPQAAVSGMLFKFYVLSMELLMVPDPSITVFVPPCILVHFIWFVFIVGLTRKPA